eukprot:scaffold40_cov305-Pinguiococcus_pyrenoidosus.AAC.11
MERPCLTSRTPLSALLGTECAYDAADRPTERTKTTKEKHSRAPTLSLWKLAGFPQERLGRRSWVHRNAVCQESPYGGGGRRSTRWTTRCAAVRGLCIRRLTLPPRQNRDEASTYQYGTTFPLRGSTARAEAPLVTRRGLAD